MAAGTRHRLKAKQAASPRGLSEYATEEGRNLKDLMIMASVPDQTRHSPLGSAPEPLSSSTFNYGNPSSLPSQHILSHPPGPLSASMTAQRRRKMSKHSMNTLKRSASTPNVRGGESGLSVADKRRNKLGYHRTSVACGTWIFIFINGKADEMLQVIAEDAK